MKRLKEVFEKFYEKYPLYGNIAFVDVETTGFSNTARIIEIGCIVVIYDGIEVEFKTFQSLMYPGSEYLPLKQEIIDVTNIQNEDLRNADGDELVLEKFVNWLEQFSIKHIVAHNRTFDENKLRYNISRLNLNFNYPQFDCTMKMASELPIKSKKLSSVAEHFGFVNEQAHRALTDTETCAFIWAKMKTK